MKRYKKLFIFFLCFVLLASFLPNTVTAEAATQSMGECVMELTSKRFLHKLNAERKLPLASTTKILTALVILESLDLGEVVEVPKQAEGTEGSSVYLKAGEKLSVKDLLYGLMLRSGNDCAVTLALRHSGSIKNFARAMNDKALSLGADSSHFTNPHGLPDEAHYTTAHDLALIAAAALENETFREIVSTKFYEPRGWKNKNKMLWEYPGATGVKTGFTVRAGRCLVSSAERNGMTLVSVVLNSPQMFERSEELLDDGFTQYSMKKICSADVPFEGYRIAYDFDYPLKRGEEVEISVCKAPESESSGQGQIGGVMKIYLENHLIFSQNLFIIE